MAGVIGTAFIDVRPDMSGFGREVQSGIDKQSGAAEEGGKRTGGAFGGGFKQTAIGVAAGSFIADFASRALSSVTDFVGGSITAASDLNETLNKISVVFGDSAGQVTDWSKNSATQFGLSRNAALSTAATFGDMFSQLGLGKKDAAGASEQMIKLAADLGSFHNVDPSDVLERLSAAFRGEYDPIQKLIPGITAARVEHQALQDTGKTSADQLTALDKALATQTILMGDSANATNDFAETSGGLANQQRIASAQLEDLKATLGQALLPVLTAVVKVINNGLIPALYGIGDWIGGHQDEMKALGIGLAGVATIIFAMVVPALLSMAASAIGAAISLAIMAAPFILAGALIAGAALLIIKHWDTIKAAAAAVWDAIKSAFGKVVDVFQGVIAWVKNNWPWLVAALAGPFGIAVKLILDHWDTIVTFFTGLPGKILGLLASIGSWLIGPGVELLTGLLTGMADKALDLFIFLTFLPVRIAAMFVQASIWLLQAGIDLVTGLVTGLIQAAPGIWQWFTNLPGKVLSFLTGAVTWLLQTGTDVIVGLWNGIVAANVWLGTQLRSIPGWIKDAAVAAASWLYDAGKWAIGGLWDGIVSSKEWIKAQVGNVASWAKEAVSNAVSWLWDAGKWIIGGLWDGMLSSKDWLIDKIKSFAGNVWDGFKSALGFGSPSKVFMQAGEPIMQGLAIGLERAYPGVQRTLTGLSRDLTSALATAVPAIPLSASLTGAAALAPGAPGAVRGPAVVVQHATFNEAVDVETFMRQAAWVAQSQAI